jgi:hypothetical protein
MDTFIVLTRLTPVVYDCSQRMDLAVADNIMSS